MVCITYTNAAVDVIAERLAKDSFILPSTIHSFAWNAIKQYPVSYTHLDVYKRQSLDNLKLDGDVLNIPLFMADQADRLIGMALEQRKE